MNSVSLQLSASSNEPQPSLSVEIDSVGDPPMDADRHVLDLPAESPPSAQSSEGCPSPLGWAEVLESFRGESTCWSVAVDGASLHGRTLGSGRPLYFLNGISGTCELFCLLAWLLREEFRCVLFDYREPNDQSRLGSRAGRPTLDLFVSDLLTVAEGQGDRAFCVFAAPFGSLVALGTLARYPERIQRAILLGGFAHRRLSGFERLLCSAGRLIPGNLSRLPMRSALQRASHQRAFPPFDASRWSFFARNTDQTTIRDLADRASLMASVDLRERLSRIERPVLLLRTEHEGAISSAGEDELERQLPQATSESIPLAGQLAYLTHPHRVAKAVRSFLGGDSSQQQGSPEGIGLDNSCCADHKDESP